MWINHAFSIACSVKKLNIWLLRYWLIVYQKCKISLDLCQTNNAAGHFSAQRIFLEFYSDRISSFERDYFFILHYYTTLLFAWHLTGIPILCVYFASLPQSWGRKNTASSLMQLFMENCHSNLAPNFTLIFTQRSLKLWDELKYLCQQRNWWKASPQKKKMKTM